MDLQSESLSIFSILLKFQRKLLELTIRILFYVFYLRIYLLLFF